MTDEQTTILRASISHWEHNLELALANREPQIGGDSCLCCQRWAEPSDSDFDCDGCPISEYTYNANCGGTPWFRVRDALDKELWIDFIGGVENPSPNFTNLRRVIQAEIDFLNEVLNANQ